MFTIVVAVAASDTARRHTRDDVARAALRLLDDVGLPDLTMRRLAAALDVQPSALYHHFPDKQTLLAAVADLIVAGPAAGPSLHDDVDGDWPSRVHEAASALRDRLLAYRDGAEVVASTLSLGLGADGARAGLAAAVAAVGLDARTTSRAAIALLHFVLGHVWHEQQRLQADSLGVVRRTPDDAETDMDDDETASFLFGVDLIVGGLRRAVDIARVPGPQDATAGTPRGA